MITGLHFIPLRKPGGDRISHVGIFVNIKLSLEEPELHQMNELSEDANIIDNFDNQTVDAACSLKPDNMDKEVHPTSILTTDV